MSTPERNMRSPYALQLELDFQDKKNAAYDAACIALGRISPDDPRLYEKISVIKTVTLNRLEELRAEYGKDDQLPPSRDAMVGIADVQSDLIDYDGLYAGMSL